LAGTLPQEVTAVPTPDVVEGGHTDVGEADTTKARNPRRHSLRISALDRPWRGAESVVSLGPLALPSLEDLRSAFVELAAQGERTRVGFTFDAHHRRWLFDPARLAEMAEHVVVGVESPELTADSPEALVLAETERLLGASTLSGQFPVRWTRAESILVQHQNHAFGDAQSMLRLPAALVSVATTGQLPKWVQEELTHFPLWAAFRNSSGPGRNPLARLLKDRPSRGLAPLKAKHGSDLDPEPWAPQLQVVVKTFSRSSWDAVQQWRRKSAPGASMASVYVVLLRLALRKAGVHITEDTVVLYDCRRNLPSGAHVRGNFVIARSQQFTDDAVAAGTKIAETAGSARPLMTLIAATAKRSLVPARPVATTIGINPTSVPAFVFVPRNGGIEAMPWVRGDLRCLGTVNAPTGPADLTAAMFLLGGRLSVSITFHSNVLSETSMRETARLMEYEAIELLQAGASPGQ